MIISTDNSRHPNPNQELGPFTTNKLGQPSEIILIPLRLATANPTSALGP